MTDSNVLGAFLKARRAQVSPADLDLPPGGKRRVPGLRREEVASLTGLSVDYYARLEQGREQHPSAAVLNALARTLRLDADAQRYLFAIATPGPQMTSRKKSRHQLGDNLTELIAEWPNHPAVVIDQCHNVLVANQLGYALYGGHRHSGNLAKLIFLDESGRTLFPDWKKVAAVSAAGMRATASHAPHDADLMALIGELTTRSPEFCTLWAKAEVKEKMAGVLRFDHPIVGQLDLHYETFRPGGMPELLLKIYRAAKGSDSAERLAMLGSLTADQTVETVREAEAAAEERARRS
ncbi:MAG TPA: helix-turn-helix transcriptional regulator [Pseudonocardiaceae bacterium]|nr:helix-turn-helix transcriptional regulator [Pseudonocardiaceae bacterium]